MHLERILKDSSNRGIAFSQVAGVWHFYLQRNTKQTWISTTDYRAFA